jgi:hypothetical protein
MKKQKHTEMILVFCLSFILVIALSYCKLVPSKVNLSTEKESGSFVTDISPTIYITSTSTIDVTNIKLQKPYGWIDFINQEYGFAIAYPNKLNRSGINQPWIYNEYAFPKIDSQKKGKNTRFWVGFGPKESIPGGMVWGVTVYEDENLEDVIAYKGEQFEDRKEERMHVKVNGIDALLVTITTSKFKDWISKEVIIQKGNIIYSVGNGAEDLSEFDSFYKSFQLLK